MGSDSRGVRTGVIHRTSKRLGTLSNPEFGRAIRILAPLTAVGVRCRSGCRRRAVSPSSCDSTNLVDGVVSLPVVASTDARAVESGLSAIRMGRDGCGSWSERRRLFHISSATRGIPPVGLTTTRRSLARKFCCGNCSSIAPVTAQTELRVPVIVLPAAARSPSMSQGRNERSGAGGSLRATCRTSLGSAHRRCRGREALS